MQRDFSYTNVKLLPGFRGGDEACFGEVFKLFFPALSYYAFRITKDRSAAEDIASESFIKIWQRREMFYESKVLKSYLYTTARNASLQWLRSEARENEKIFPARDFEVDHMEGIIHAEVLREIYDLLDTMPVQRKKVVTKLYMEGKTVKQTSAELNIAIGTVKTHKAKALAVFRKKLRLLLTCFIY
jgi:RNA polymerase sigma factor (sigma-70 family)